MRQNVYSSADFAGGHFVLKFYLGRVVPINRCWRQKTRDTGLPDGEDRIPLRSLVLTQYRSVTDGKTDRRICRSIYCACKTSFAARCKMSEVTIKG